MRSALIYIIFILGLFLACNVHAQVDTARIIPIAFDGAIKNPLKGFRYNSNEIGKYPYDAIARTYIKWNEIERNGADGIDRVLQVSNQKWSNVAENNTKVIPRVYLDWDSKTGNEYWPSDMETGDYTSEQFKQRLEDLIIKMGKAWDNDSRVAWVQMGIIGYWGEHHHPAPNEWQQELLGDMFSKAFQNKKVLIRRPWETFENYEFGWYWDSFAHWDQISSQAVPMMENCPDRWKTEPIEGEVAYNWGNYTIQPGSSPSETLKDPGHREWLINYIRKMHCTGLGWVSDYDRYNTEVIAGAEEVQKVFGYRYILKEVTYPKTITPGEPFPVSFDVENTGSAPFYYDWPVELRLLDPVTYAVKWKKVFSSVDIRDWMPGEEWNETTQAYDLPAPLKSNSESFTVDQSLPKGEYILALAVLDPAGMEPSLRFATAQYFTGGNHPIGYIGVEVAPEQDLLNPSVFDDPSIDLSLHYQVISRYQAPFGGSSHSIPGLIEAEHYDAGGEGLAYHDDDVKQGNAAFRPDDNVDVEVKSGASNGFVVSYTEADEWLEYTVNALRGRYDLTLYYYSGDTPGELLVSLDGDVPDTIAGLRNLGWDQADSVVVGNVVIAVEGEDKILRLEFINGAGFDVDAIKFTRLPTPVEGLSMTSCPPDTLLSGLSYQLSASVDPPYADDPTVQWESSDETIATVDAGGKVKTLREGYVTITATSNDGGFSSECFFFIEGQEISVYGVSIGGCPNFVMETGNTHQLTANVAPPDATDTSVTWSSSNPSVATVDTTGLVTGISQGTTKITITTNDGGFKSTCNIGVMAASSTNDFPSVSELASIYPNPSSEKVFVRFSDAGTEKRIHIYNLYGQLLRSERSFDSEMEIDIREFTGGTTLIFRIQSGGASTFSRVIIDG